MKTRFAIGTTNWKVAIVLTVLVSTTALAIRSAILAAAERDRITAELIRGESERERAQSQSDNSARLQKFAESKETDAQLQRAAAESQRALAQHSLLNERKKSASTLEELQRERALLAVRSHDLGNSLVALGNVYESSARVRDAEKAWRDALREAEAALSEDENDLAALSIASKSCLSIARIIEGTGAVNMARSSVAYAERLIALDRSPPPQIWLAKVRGVAALVFAKADLLNEAVKLAAQSTEAQSRIPEPAFADWSAIERAQVKALVESTTSN